MSKRKTLRVIHSAALLRPSSGMLKQMQWEQDAAKHLGLSWSVKMYCPKKSIKPIEISHFDSLIDGETLTTRIRKLKAWIQLRINYHNWLISMQDDVDVYILRYYVHDPFQLLFMNRCKKPVYLIHHTLEIPELSMENDLTSRIRSTLEKLLGKLTLKKSAGIIGVTDEIIRHEIARAKLKETPTHVYPNGIIYNNKKIKDNRTSLKPEFLFVSNFAPWHGLDLLLNEIKKSKDDFILHLVGKIPEELTSLTNDSRIVVHGNLNHEQITDLSQKCWIGLSTLALFRKKMKQACPLKTREYLMLGLAVYGDSDDVLPEEVPYIKKGPVNIRKMIDYAEEMRNIKKTDISNNSKKYIEKTTLLQSLNDHLTKEANKNSAHA